jgi:hypothetical protein
MLRDLFTWKSTIRKLRDELQKVVLVSEAAIIDRDNLAQEAKELKDSAVYATSEMDRVSHVKACLQDKECLVGGRPFIEAGLYNWLNINNPIYLDFLFPDVPLAILVKPNMDVCPGAYKHTDVRVGNRISQEAAYVTVVCHRAGVPLMVVEPEDKTDVYTIALKVRKALESWKE